MTVDQLPVRVREFANYLNGLLARLDHGGGWCGVFWQRDPEGMRACLDGREMPPWDVVEALLQDLAVRYGPDEAGAETERARALHAAALVAYDTRPGGRDALGDRFDVMLREQRYAADRQAELSRSLAVATTQEEADALRLDLAWARDDHDRATRRCAELRSRMTELDRRAMGEQARATRQGDGEDGSVFRVRDPFRTDDGTRRSDGHGPGDARRQTNGPYAEQPEERGSNGDGFPSMPHQREARSVAEARGWQEEGQADAGTSQGTSGAGEAEGAASPEHDSHPTGHPTHADAPQWSTPADLPAAQAPSPRQRRRRRGSARFAGMAEGQAAPVVVPPAVVPELPAAPVATRRTPRGARFAGAARAGVRPKPQAEPVDAAAGRETVETVGRLVRLRGEGRSGEAHALLAEIAYWPATRYPLLADEMQRAGLGADWATLLWEAASLPADRLVAAADALVEAGRDTDGEQILRQGVARPAEEIGRAVLALAGDGRRREVRALLDAYVRVRTPEEAARSAEPDPQTLVPLLLEAARGVSDERHWDLVHALRVAGFTA
jgi:hypothetical protein